MEGSSREVRPTRRWLWGLVALLLALNLAAMAVDTLVLPEQGIREVVQVSPSARVQVRPEQRPSPLDFLLGPLGVRQASTERPQPGMRPEPQEPRPRPTVAAEPSLRAFSLHQPGWGGMALHLVALLALVSTAIALTYFLPTRFRIMRDALGGSFPHKIRTLVIGILAYLAALLLASLLAVVVSGLPFAVLIVASLVVLTAVGVTAVSLALGRWLSSLAGAEARPLAQLLLGLLLVFPLTILPYFGWAAAGIMASFGLGAILLTRMGSGRPWSLEALK